MNQDKKYFHLLILTELQTKVMRVINGLDDDNSYTREDATDDLLDVFEFINDYSSDLLMDSRKKMKFHEDGGDENI